MFPNPVILIIVVFAGFETWRRWKQRRAGGAEQEAYYRVSPRDRALVAAVYLALIALLVIGMNATHLRPHAGVSAERHDGGCLCGAVRYRIDGPLRDVVVCHCSRCRRAQGHVAAYSDCATADLTVTGEPALRWYVADERRRGFCSVCGVQPVLARARMMIRPSRIAAGTLDPPTGLRTVAQIFCATPGDYYASAGEGERFEQGLPPAPGRPNAGSACPARRSASRHHRGRPRRARNV